MICCASACHMAAAHASATSSSVLSGCQSRATSSAGSVISRSGTSAAANPEGDVEDPLEALLVGNRLFAADVLEQDFHADSSSARAGSWGVAENLEAAP